MRQVDDGGKWTVAHTGLSLDKKGPVFSAIRRLSIIEVFLKDRAFTQIVWTVELNALPSIFTYLERPLWSSSVHFRSHRPFISTQGQLLRCWLPIDVGDNFSVLVMEFRYCHLYHIGDIFWMLVPYPVKRLRILPTKTTKTVINISNLSPKHYGTNNRHQHRCSRKAFLFDPGPGSQGRPKDRSTIKNLYKRSDFCIGHFWS